MKQRDKDKFRENICLYFEGAPTVEEEERLKNILLQKSQIQTTILLKNMLNFLSPLSERIFAESLLEAASETELLISHFLF